MNLIVRSTLALSMLVNGVALAQALPPPPYAVGVPQKPRSCSASSFTLEVPLWANALPTTFESSFASFFAGDPRWFGLTSGWIQPRLTPVLPEYTGSTIPLVRRDGHRRSFVVTFQRLGGYPPTWGGVPPVLPMYACAVVSALREAAARALSITIGEGMLRQPPVLVSRSCDAVVQDAESGASASTLEWSTKRVEAMPTPGLQAIDVALIDTGVDKAWRSALGVVAEGALPSFERVTRAEYHPHGAQMAALIRSVAPNARIRSYRALDGRGMGSLVSVARAVDDAVFDPAISTGTRKPLIVNLSLGAPPDLAGPTYLTGPRPDGSGCSSWEDGQGETLRYVLHVAGQFELMQQQGVFVAASGGNTPLEFASTSMGSVVGGSATTVCSGVNSALPAASSFLPAAFGERASCRASATWLPVLPVGASTFEDRRSVVTRFQAEPRVYAPGERVFAVSSAFPSAGTAAACGATDIGFAHALESPGPVTGTSAAAALTSGAAAHLMGSQYGGPLLSGWRAADMARLLYLTGQPLCSAKGVPGVGRRISITRATEAVSSPSCSALRSCLRSASHPVGPMVGAATESVCASAVATCFGATASLACPAFAEEPGWGSYADNLVPGASCAASWMAPLGLRVPAPLALFPDQQLSGLGPQPSQSGCPNCSLMAQPWRLDLRFELSDAFEGETDLRDAFLIIFDEEKRPLEWVSISDGRVWRPGEVGELKVYPLTMGVEELYARLLYRSWSVGLDLALTPSEGEPSRSISPLRVEFLR
ncbi:MAG: S8/S53 family peptidase [Archangium sp.]|nr:S8/S53 family peptidase [Archangium sp.]